jgi:hypothetical protein
MVFIGVEKVAHHRTPDGGHGRLCDETAKKGTEAYWRATGPGCRA